MLSVGDFERMLTAQVATGGDVIGAYIESHRGNAKVNP
jgi:hypothetical protein